MNAGRKLDALIAEKPYKCRVCGNTEYKLMSGKRCCWPCHKAHSEIWRKSNPEKHNKSARTAEGRVRFKNYRKNWALKARYGITLEKYNEMVEMQSNGCLICKGNQSLHRPLVVDHCHKTGNIRGLLCDPCNIGLSNFRDNPERMESAANYIRSAPHAICLAALKAVGYKLG